MVKTQLDTFICCLLSTMQHWPNLTFWQPRIQELNFKQKLKQSFVQDFNDTVAISMWKKALKLLNVVESNTGRITRPPFVVCSWSVPLLGSVPNSRRAGRCLQLVRPISGKWGSERGLLSSCALIGSPEKLHYIHGADLTWGGTFWV